MATKKKKDGYLTAEQRPLFAPWNAVHETTKDKQNKRAYKKKQLRKELGEYNG